MEMWQLLLGMLACLFLRNRNNYIQYDEINFSTNFPLVRNGGGRRPLVVYGWISKKIMYSNVFHLQLFQD